MQIKVTSKKDKITGEKKVILVQMPDSRDIEWNDAATYDAAMDELKAYGAHYNPEIRKYSFNPVHRDKVVEICKNLAIRAGWSMPNHVQDGKAI